jgi:hypothetical protein
MPQRYVPCCAQLAWSLAQKVLMANVNSMLICYSKWVCMMQLLLCWMEDIPQVLLWVNLVILDLLCLYYGNVRKIISHE